MKAPKMTDLIIEETSGVDHPAHLHEGWIIAKASDVHSAADVMDALPDPVEGNMADEATDAAKAEDEVQDAVTAEATDEQTEDQQDELAIANARIEELEARLAEVESKSEQEPETEKAEDDSEDALLAKAAPEVREMIVKERQARAEAEAALTKEREDRADAEAIAKARADYAHLSNIDPEKVGPALRRLAQSDPDLAKAVSDALAAADAQQDAANIFAEIGKNASTKTDAYSRMQAMAKAKVDAGEYDTTEKAFAAVVSERPDLYNDYLTEKGA